MYCQQGPDARPSLGDRLPGLLHPGLGGEHCPHARRHRTQVHSQAAQPKLEDLQDRGHLGN